MATRKQNEATFSHWIDLAGGGRRYWYDRQGKRSGWALYIKIVDGNENTLAMMQEVYDDKNRLTAIHEKFPIDKGHRRLPEEHE